LRGPTVYGDAGTKEDVDATLLVWGSTLPAACEAVTLLAADGIRANVLHYMDLWPVSDAAAPLTMRAMPTGDATAEAGGAGASGCGGGRAKEGMLVAVEQNYSGQMSLIHRMITGRAPDLAVLKYDGRQISPREIADGVREGLQRGRKEGTPDA